MRQLRQISAADLFLQSCGEIKDEDLIEFLIADEKYPFSKLVKRYANESPIPVHSEQFKKDIISTIANRKKLIEALAYHDMFRQLSGNPTSITMIAALLKNPLIERTDNNPLVDMYKRIKSEKDIVVNELEEKNGVATVYKNNMSLQISTEASVNLLEQASPEDMSLLYFLGCLPGGVKEDQLKKMYDQNIEKGL